MLGLLKRFFGTANDRIIKKLNNDVKIINELETVIKNLSDLELKNKTQEFKSLIEQGKSLDQIMHEAFAVVREASFRVLGMRHFDVQLMGGIILHRGMISEMRTGEGKTLVSTLPCYLNALTGKGVHIVTVNDYLVRRDSQILSKLYTFLGLTVGSVYHGLPENMKQNAYMADITFATNNELGFDFLRDNMKHDPLERVQKQYNYG